MTKLPIKRLKRRKIGINFVKKLNKRERILSSFQILTRLVPLVRLVFIAEIFFGLSVSTIERKLLYNKVLQAKKCQKPLKKLVTV